MISKTEHFLLNGKKIMLTSMYTIENQLVGFFKIRLNKNTKPSYKKKNKDF